MAATASAQSVLGTDNDWSRGIVRDAPRGALPQGSVYDDANFLLHEPGVAQKRGGTTYAGPALTGATYGTAVAYAPFSSGSKILALGENSHLYNVTAGTTTDLGSTGLTVDTPKFRVGASKEILVIPISDGTTSPKAYKLSGGSFTLGALGGSPPAGKYASVFKTRLALAGSTANPDRIYFSDVPDIESTWDTAESWVDTDYEISGIAALQNMIIVFSEGKTQKITGTTPAPGSDFDRQPIGDVGCTDARSIVIYEGRVIFANQRGVYWTDGTTYQCLTRLAGIETLWRDYCNKASFPYLISGVLGSFLIVSVVDPSSRVPIATLMCNLPRNAWWRLTNIQPMMLASAVGVADECYYADSQTNRIVALSTILTPGAAYKNDADGTAVTCLLETRLLGGGPTLKHFGFGEVSIDMRDAASDSPTMALSVAPGLEGAGSTAVKESPFAASASLKRRRFTVGKVSQGVTLSFQQTNASSKTELYSMELAIRSLPYGAGGQ